MLFVSFAGKELRSHLDTEFVLKSQPTTVLFWESSTKSWLRQNQSLCPHKAGYAFGPMSSQSRLRLWAYVCTKAIMPLGLCLHQSRLCLQAYVRTKTVTHSGLCPHKDGYSFGPMSAQSRLRLQAYVRTKVGYAFEPLNRTQSHIYTSNFNSNQQGNSEHRSCSIRNL